MIQSAKERLFNLWLSKLNENTQGITFDGNFMFQFSRAGTYDFEIISRDEDSLDFERTEVVPVVNAQQIETPYIQLNEQSDWEIEVLCALKVDETRHPITNKKVIEFNGEDLRYQALLETTETLKNQLTFIEGDYKYTFKVREPNKVNVFKYNGSYYQVLSITFNLTTLTSGFFGNETKIYLGLKSDGSFDETSDYELDVLQFNEVVGKTTRDNSNETSDEVVKKADKRTWEASMSVNFNGNVADLLLYDELSAQATLDNEYQVYITNEALNTLTGENKDYTYDVIITSINGTKEKNIVDKITFTLERT